MYPVELVRHGSGFIMGYLVAGEDLPPKKLVYIDGNGEWSLCDSDTLAMKLAGWSCFVVVLGP